MLEMIPYAYFLFSGFQNTFSLLLRICSKYNFIIQNYNYQVNPLLLNNLGYLQSFAIINNDIVNIFVHKTLLIFQNYIVRIDSFKLVTSSKNISTFIKAVDTYHQFALQRHGTKKSSLKNHIWVWICLVSWKFILNQPVNI